jgi:membrane-anchored protein YejM (alkaline phosphatase superfamily)
MMDTQYMFNMVLSVATFFGAWVLNSITKMLSRIDKDVRGLPSTYVLKQDYNRDVDEIKHMLNKVLDKLDNKADK